MPSILGAVAAVNTQRALDTAIRERSLRSLRALKQKSEAAKLANTLSKVKKKAETDLLDGWKERIEMMTQEELLPPHLRRNTSQILAEASSQNVEYGKRLAKKLINPETYNFSLIAEKERQNAFEKAKLRYDEQEITHPDAKSSVQEVKIPPQRNIEKKLKNRLSRDIRRSVDSTARTKSKETSDTKNNRGKNTTNDNLYNDVRHPRRADSPPSVSQKNSEGQSGSTDLTFSEEYPSEANTIEQRESIEYTSSIPFTHISMTSKNSKNTNKESRIEKSRLSTVASAGLLSLAAVRAKDSIRNNTDNEYAKAIEAASSRKRSFRMDLAPVNLQKSRLNQLNDSYAHDIQMTGKYKAGVRGGGYGNSRRGWSIAQPDFGCSSQQRVASIGEVVGNAVDYPRKPIEGSVPLPTFAKFSGIRNIVTSYRAPMDIEPKKRSIRSRYGKMPEWAEPLPELGRNRAYLGNGSTNRANRIVERNNRQKNKTPFCTNSSIMTSSVEKFIWKGRLPNGRRWESNTIRMNKMHARQRKKEELRLQKVRKINYMREERKTSHKKLEVGKFELKLEQEKFLKI